MKFSTLLQERCFPPFKKYYIAYNDLKEIVKILNRGLYNTLLNEIPDTFKFVHSIENFSIKTSDVKFQYLLSYEVNKINKFTELVYCVLLTSLREIVFYLNKNTESVNSLNFINNLYYQALLISEYIIHLNNYVRICLIGFRKITKKYDKQNNSTFAYWYLARLARESFVSINFEKLLIAQCKCFSILRKIQLSFFPKNFENNLSNQDLKKRKLTYVMNEDNVMMLKIVLAQHLTLCRLGSKNISIMDLNQLNEDEFVNNKKEACDITSEDFIKKINMNIRLISTDSFLTDYKSNHPAVSGALELIHDLYSFDMYRFSDGSLFFDKVVSDSVHDKFTYSLDQLNGSNFKLQWTVDDRKMSLSNTCYPILLDERNCFSIESYTNILQRKPLPIPRQHILKLLSGTLSYKDYIVDNIYMQTIDLINAKKLIKLVKSCISQHHYKPIFQMWMYSSNYSNSLDSVIPEQFLELNLYENICFVDAKQRIQNMNLFWFPPHVAPWLVEDIIHPSQIIVTLSLTGDLPQYILQLETNKLLIPIENYSPFLHGMYYMSKDDNLRIFPEWINHFKNFSSSEYTKLLSLYNISNCCLKNRCCNPKIYSTQLLLTNFSNSEYNTSQILIGSSNDSKHKFKKSKIPYSINVPLLEEDSLQDTNNISDNTLFNYLSEKVVLKRLNLCLLLLVLSLILFNIRYEYLEYLALYLCIFIFCLLGDTFFIFYYYYRYENLKDPNWYNKYHQNSYKIIFIIAFLLFFVLFILVLFRIFLI